MEENVFYKPGEPSSVMSLNEEVDLFASCVNIYTTETDVYGDIMDEPRELEVFDEGAWALNLATGIVATLGLAACAIAVVATGGAALAVVAFASAAVGTGVMTAGMSYADKKNQKNRSNLEYGIGLMLGAAVGALTGVGIMYAGPALTVAGEQAGFEASFLMGTNALTVSTIPDIVTAGGMTLLATDGAYALNEINTMCTGQNLAVDTVFEGNEENYEACVVALQVLNEGLLDLTTRGYQRNGSGSSSSEAEKSDEGAEISESGVNIRGAGDESGGKTFKFSDMTESEIVKIVERYRKKAPIEIPDTAKYKAKSMADGYEQISYKWNDGTYKYEVRWHTRTSGAPEGQGNTWVIQRTIPGNGGKKPSTQFLIGENEWVEGWKWYDAISARKNGTATQEQIELLDKGHWKE